MRKGVCVGGNNDGRYLEHDAETVVVPFSLKRTSWVTIEPSRETELTVVTEVYHWFDLGPDCGVWVSVLVLNRNELMSKLINNYRPSVCGENR